MTDQKDERTLTEREFSVEIGRVRTVEEIKEKLERFKPIASRKEAEFEEARAIESGPKRDAAFERYDAYPNGTEVSLVVQGLQEILEELKPLEGLYSLIEKISDSAQREEKLSMYRKAIEKIAESGVRNARYWLDLFGMDSYVRIEVFSWIWGVEPNFEPLDDPTEDEEEMFSRQMQDMGNQIKEALKMIEGDQR